MAGLKITNLYDQKQLEVLQMSEAFISYPLIDYK